MFKLDDKFLEELGLAALPQDEKEEFLKQIYSEMEIRVGERLTDDMSDEILDEFSNFASGNEEGMRKWFTENLPDYAEQDDFKKIRENNPQVPEAVAMSEYGAMKWLQLNRPNYPDIVAAVLEEIKDEIRASRAAILQGVESAGGTVDGQKPTDLI